MTTKSTELAAKRQANLDAYIEANPDTPAMTVVPDTDAAFAVAKLPEGMQQATRQMRGDPRGEYWNIAHIPTLRKKDVDYYPDAVAGIADSQEEAIAAAQYSYRLLKPAEWDSSDIDGLFGGPLSKHTGPHTGPNGIVSFYDDHLKAVGEEEYRVACRRARREKEAKAAAKKSRPKVTTEAVAEIEPDLQADELKHHPAADAFPMMDDPHYGELRDDIERNGQIDPITVQDGKILDGRNRYKACIELGIEPSTREHDGDPWAYVWSLNGQRRDLVAEQRYLIWKECNEHSDTWQAEKQRIAEAGNRKRSKATKKQPRKSGGELASTGARAKSPSTGKEPGRKAKAAASGADVGAVKRGDDLASNHPDLAADVRLGRKKPAAAHREAKKREIGDKVAALPKGKHTVIYADPPWSYNDKCGEGAVQAGGCERHYPSMSSTELKALDVPTLAADDSVLFLWATSPLLPDALSLASAWGFKYKASFVWDKVLHNMGHYNSVRHEFLLICTRGSCTPQVSQLFDSVQSIERTKHSGKPAEFRQIIETLYPKGRKIELFARAKTKGWKAWGNEC